jgi:hypothetical protein
MKFQGFIGPAYQLDSVQIDAQRCVNWYPEVIESGTGKGAQVAFLAETPGLEEFIEVGDGPIRCVHVDNVGRLWVVSGNKLYLVYYESGVLTASPVDGGDSGSFLETSTGPVKAKSSIPADGGGLNRCDTLFVDGEHIYKFIDYGTGGFTDFVKQSYDGNAHPGGDAGATQLVWADSFFIINEIDTFFEGRTNRFWVSARSSMDFDGLNFEATLAGAGALLAMESNHNDLWLFYETFSEVYVNTGNGDFPFDRVQGGYIEVGCAAEYSVAKIDGTIFWLGKSKDGTGQVFAARGLQPQRVSTHAIERTIANYGDISNASAWTYESLGHKFYVLNFDEATWVYDLSTGLWHERAYTNNGTLERHRAQYHAFHSGVIKPVVGIYPTLNIGTPTHFVSDYESNKLYILKEGVYTDNGDAITRIRTTPHLSSNLSRMTCHEFKLDMVTGVGLDGDGQSSDPKIMLTWSKDGGHTWSSENWESIGKQVGGIGEYSKRVIWRRLGMFRDIIFSVKITDPVKARLIDAFLTLEGSDS